MLIKVTNNGGTNGVPCAAVSQIVPVNCGGQTHMNGTESVWPAR